MWQAWSRLYEVEKISQAGKLAGISNIKQGTKIEIKPYLLAGTQLTDKKPENSFKVINENRKLSLFKLETNKIIPQYDTLKLLNFLTSFADIRYEALLNDMDPHRKDSIVNSTPENILTVVNNEGDSSKIITFLKPNDKQSFNMEGNIYVHDLDRLYALVNDGQDFVLIQYYVFDKVLRPLSYFETE